MRLTAATVRTLTLPPGKADHVFFDSDLPGPWPARARHRRKTWMVQYAIAGKTRRMALGSPAVLDPGKARETAKDLLAQVRLGRDPAGEKATARAKAAETFGALLPRFLERQRARLKPRSLEETERHLVAHAQAAAWPPDRRHRSPRGCEPPGRDRQGERAGREQPGAHVAVGVLLVGRTRGLRR